MKSALVEMESWLLKPTGESRSRLIELLARMREVHIEYKRIAWGTVRLITDCELLIFEYALSCLLAHETGVGWWSYQTARHYAERYESSAGTGLISTSIPLLQDIVDFWMQEYDLDETSLHPPRHPSRSRKKSPLLPAQGAAKSGKRLQMRFTDRQGQFLAFIYLYWKLHRRGPAETDLVKYFRVTPPAVHGMVVKLEELGLIAREPGVARSMRVVVPVNELPNLHDLAGPPW